MNTIKDNPVVKVSLRKLETKEYTPVTVASVLWKIRYCLSGNNEINTLFSKLAEVILKKRFSDNSGGYIRAKTRCSYRDYYDPNIGKDIATSRVKLKAYKLALNRIGYLKDYLLEVIDALDSEDSRIRSEMTKLVDSIEENVE